MKSFNKLSGILLPAVMVASVLASHNVLAGTYNSAVNLPVLHSKGYLYKAHLPVPAGPKDGHLIKNISWNWNVQGWPRGLQVSLCQTPTRCIDVSRQRTGSTSAFNNFLATHSFYYELKLSPTGPAPVAGQFGRIGVVW